MPPDTRVPRFWTVRELAERLRVSRVWIFRLYRAGRLRGQVIGRLPGEERGGRLLFTEREVLRFLHEQGVPLDVDGA